MEQFLIAPGRRISVKKKRLNDEWLAVIGRRQPSSLELIQCRGNAVTPAGLRELFRQCASSLQVYLLTYVFIYLFLWSRTARRSEP